MVTAPTETQDANLLWATRVYSNDTIELVLERIETAKKTPHWLHLYTHDVRENPSQFGCSIYDFRTVVNAVKESGLRVMTVDQAYETIIETLQST